MSKKIINTDAAPKAIGPYSQAVIAGDMMFVSGQIPIVPETGLIDGDNFKQQAIRVLSNLEAICKEANADLSDIVKLNVYLADLENFVTFNEIMKANFSSPYPARAAVEISRLPKDVLVEAEAVVYLKK